MTALESIILSYLANSLWQLPLLFAAGWLAARALRWPGPVAEHGAWVSVLLLQALLPAAGPILFGLVTAPQDEGERQAEKAAGNAREFEVASIKPSKSDAATMTYTAYGLKAEGVTLRFLIRQAYGVDDDEILGGPEWIKSKTYDVEAKGGGADVVDLTKLSLD